MEGVRDMRSEEKIDIKTITSHTCTDDMSEIMQQYGQAMMDGAFVVCLTMMRDDPQAAKSNEKSVTMSVIAQAAILVFAKILDDIPTEHAQEITKQFFEKTCSSIFNRKRKIEEKEHGHVR